MKPIPGLDDLLARGVKLGIFGTKMRSFIKARLRRGNLGHREAAV